MNCFCTTQTNSASDSCCRANELCSFSGNLDDVTATPIYVQSVYDAVRFNLQGMRTVQNLKFTPSIPCGCSISRIIDIRIKKVFDPGNASDCNNLTLEMETGISGASFVNNSCGVVETIGPDGVPSEKLLFADTSECDSTGCGTPIFGTQNAKLWGNVNVYMDIAICDSCGRENCMTLCAELNIARQNCPLVLTNFFELCMPSTSNSAFLPRLTELANAGFTARLATNNASRDISMNNNGEITANLIIAICITAEKKITVPVQLCVLSTGFTDVPLQENVSGVMTCPGLFPERNDGASDSCINQAPPQPGGQNSFCDPCSTRSCDEPVCACSDYPPSTC